MRRSALASFAFVAALALTVAAAPPAFAANIKTTFTAGYAVSDGGGFTAATGKMLVPAMTCPTTGFHSYLLFMGWFSPGGQPSRSVTVHVTLRCQDGVGTLGGELTESDAEGYTGRFFTVAAGDLISARFSYDPATGTIRGSATNTRTDQRVNVAGHTMGLQWTSAQFALQNAFGGSDEEPVFDRVTFSGLTLDGAPLATAATSLTAFDIYDSTLTRPLVRAGKFNPAGNTFNDVWVASS